LRYVFGIGMQSGGTTIISAMWLRRPDTDGVLDTPDGDWPLASAGDALSEFEIFHQKLCFSVGPINPESVCQRVALRPGDDVSWYLIIRNPYDVARSLKTKVYGVEWKVKLAKYHRYYLLAEERGIPIIEFERFVRDPGWQMSQLFARVGVAPVEVDVSQAISGKRVYRYVPGNRTYLENQRRIATPARTGSITDEEQRYISELCAVMCERRGYSA
jgi:hypothetical protein